MTTAPPPGWVCRWPCEPTTVSHWHRGDDRITVSLLSEHVIGIEMVGHLSNEPADFLHDAIAEFLYRSGAAYLFWDNEAFQSYEPGLRDGIVKLLERERSQWKQMHVLFDSPFIGMTATAAGFILGRRIDSYRSRSSFIAVLERMLDPSSTS